MSARFGTSLRRDPEDSRTLLERINAQVRERLEEAVEFVCLDLMVQRRQRHGRPTPDKSSQTDRQQFTGLVREFLLCLHRAFWARLSEAEQAHVSEAAAALGDEEPQRLLAIQVSLAQRLPDYWQQFEQLRAAFVEERLAAPPAPHLGLLSRLLPRWRRSRALVALATLSVPLGALPTPATAEVSIGLTGGAVFGADQDLKVKQFGPGSQLLSADEQRDRSVSPGPFGGLTITVWGEQFPAFGLQLDAVHWRVSTETQPGTPPELTVTQERTALFLSLLGRVPLLPTRGVFAYAGFGGGAVLSSVSPGAEEIGPSVSVLTGIAAPLASHLRLRVEARFIVTPDVDATRGPGTRVETSGTDTPASGRFLFGSHLDTGFFPVVLGLDWVF
ncbi:MAG: hypothetical protein ACE5JN_10060 [Candidatus Methylomirabilia bacterium]